MCKQRELDDGEAERIDDSSTDYNLVGALVAHLVWEGSKQAKAKTKGYVPVSVLVFTSGVGEIDKVIKAASSAMQQWGCADDALWLLPLHSGLTAQEQARVFDRPPQGTTKVVVSTNIAETSITIEGTVHHRACTIHYTETSITKTSRWWWIPAYTHHTPTVHSLYRHHGGGGYLQDEGDEIRLTGTVHTIPYTLYPIPYALY
jgi:hypothetical protein